MVQSTRSTRTVKAMRQPLFRILSALCALPVIGQRVCFRGRRSSRHVAVTFDDGPHPEYTDQVLEALDRLHVKATFFLLGRELEKRPHMLKRIMDDGHEIGVHGFDHKPSGLPEQIHRCEALLSEAGVTSALLRPPAGRISMPELLWVLSRRYAAVFWSFDAHDSMRHEGKWREPADYDCIAAGDIVLMHDDNPVCVRELPALVDATRGNGLEPVTISQLLSIGHPRSRTRRSGSGK